MKKISKISLFNIVFLILTIISDLCYMFINTSEYITKTIASLIFVIGGMVNLIYVLKNKENYASFPLFKWFMMIGLIFACMGDLFLIDIFEAGVIFFALGHVFYFISFLFIQKFKLKDLICCLSLSVISALIILLYKGFEFNGLLPLILVYAIVISFMVGKAVSNFIEIKTKENLLVSIGTIMFFLSDLFLLFRLFANFGRIGSVLCLIFYYPAQFLLAFSILKVSKNYTQGEK